MTATAPTTSKTYWRSLEELSATPEFTEFLHREFPAAASEFPQGISRRRWLQLMGASLAMAGISGCWQKDVLAPFAGRPGNRVPGVPQKFATAYETGGAVRPLIVTAYDGRPIKVEGHVDHPGSLGGTDAFSQASILNMYDPDRSQQLLELQDGKKHSREWDEFTEFAKGLFGTEQESGGKGLRVVAERSSSPTRHRLTEQFLKRFPQAKWYEYEAVSRGNERAGSALAFGEEVRPVYNLSQADVILALDSDLFDFHPSSVSAIRAWSTRRVPEAGPMNRMYAVESQFSALGTAADHRLAVRSSGIGAFLAQVESAVKSAVENPDKKAEHSAKETKAEQFIRVVASDLAAHPGRSVVIVGSTQPAAVHAAAYRLNQTLKNVGQTVSFVKELPSVAVKSADPLVELAGEIEKGEVSTVVIFGGNPAYESKAFATALPKAKNRLRLGDYVDETSLLSTWHLPRAHQFESWGDGYSYDGILTLRQPLIDKPIFGSRSDEEVLALFAAPELPKPGDEEMSIGETLVRETLKSSLGSGDFDTAWRKLVHDGFSLEGRLPAATPTLQAPGEIATEAPASGLEVVFAPGSSTYDGRYANNGWLQETPDVLTKITWQNAAILAPKTAKDLKVTIGDIVRIELNNQTIELPVYVLPGQAQQSIGLALGYGRTAAGHVGGDTSNNVPPVGVNVSVLRAKGSTNFDSGAKVTATGRRMTLATTQDHHAIDTIGMQEIAGRIGELVREGTETQYAKHPDFAQHKVHHPPLESLWKERSAEGHAWGMSIDLSRCIGCNACLVACQSENNVPIVGPVQIAKGREMHWIRVDRYFKTEDDDVDFDNPQVVTQPVTCHHCENAPCEQVCPVAATTHSPEGLNDMAYNRCVGTRYCANNCPYKVRRFNFLDFTSHLSKANEELARLVINPEVTVRNRGVMEKCTFCVQRIQSVKITAKNAQEEIADGSIQTACQQACAAGAINFGDLMNKDSEVSKAHANPRAYAMLAELNVKPRTKYLARIRNPHPELAPAEESTHGHHEEHAEHHG